MAASDNLAAMEPWVYRPTTTFTDSWISEAFARDTKALTMALQKSLMGNNNGGSSSESAEFLPFVDTFQTETTPTPTVSGVSGSDPESSPATKRQRNHQVPVASGKVVKRKSRASKRTQTTFITADPANFRQMVQQVTGVRFSNGNGNGLQFCSANNTIVKPAQQRLGIGGCMLPTLDTSAFLFDRQQQQRQQYQQQQQGVGPAGGVRGPMLYGGGNSRVEVVEGGGVSGGGLGFDSCSSFPTLESWS